MYLPASPLIILPKGSRLKSLELEVTMYIVTWVHKSTTTDPDDFSVAEFTSLAMAMDHIMQCHKLWGIQFVSLVRSV